MQRPRVLERFDVSHAVTKRCRRPDAERGQVLDDAVGRHAQHVLTARLQPDPLDVENPRRGGGEDERSDLAAHGLWGSGRNDS